MLTCTLSTLIIILGTLLNSVLIEICTSVTSLEDISSDDAIQLHSLLSIIIHQASDLFLVEESLDEGKQNDKSAGTM